MSSEFGLLRREDIAFDRLKIRIQSLKNSISRGYSLRLNVAKALKHSIAVHLLGTGVDIMFVKNWLSHKNIRNTIVYSQLTSKTRDE